MSRTGRALTWSTVVIFAVVALLLLAVWIALATSGGAKFVLARAEAFFPDGMTIADIDGPIAGPLTVNGFRYATPTITIDLERLELDWQPMILLFSAAEVRVDYLHMDGLVVALANDPDAPTEPEAESPAGIPAPLSLPVHIFVGKLRLNRAEIRLAEANTETPAGTGDATPAAEPITVTSLQASNLAWDNKGINLPQLAIRAALIDLDSKAHIDPKGDWPLRLAATYTARPPGVPGTTGTTDLSGSLARLNVRQHLASPYSLDATAVVDAPLTALKWQTELTLAGTPVQAFVQDLPPAVVTGNINATGNLSNMDLAASLRSGSAAMTTNGAVTFPDASGSAPSVNLTLSWESLRWPIEESQAPYQVASSQGEASVTGTLDNYRASIKSQLAVPEYPQGIVDLSGTGTTSSFAFQTLTLNALGGEVTGSADANWATGLNATVKLNGMSLDPGGLAPEWPGSINFVVDASVAMSDAANPAGARVTVSSAEIDGTLRDQPVEVSLAGDYANFLLNLQSLNAKAGSTTIGASGQIHVGENGNLHTARAMDLQWQFKSEDLSMWLGNTRGRLDAKGTAVGRPLSARVTASATGADLAMSGISTETLTLTADVGLDGGPLNLNLAATRLQASGNDLGTVSAELQGTTAAHPLRVSTDGRDGKVLMALTGNLSGIPAEDDRDRADAWQDISWQFDINDLRLEYPQAPTMSLVKSVSEPPGGAVSSTSFSLRPTCLKAMSNMPTRSDTPPSAIGSDVEAINPTLPNDQGNERSELCASAANTPTGAIAKVLLHELPLALVEPALPETLRISGSLDGDADVVWNSAASGLEAVDVTARITSSAIALLTMDDNRKFQTTFAFDPAEVTATIANGVARAQMQLPISDGGSINAFANLANNSADINDRTLTGELNARLANIEFLAEFLPQVTQLKGKLDSDLVLSGTINRPVLNGTLSLSGGQAALAGPEITLREISVNLTGGGNNNLTLTASTKSGGGLLSLEGKVDGLGPDLTSQMTLKGQRFRVMNTAEAQVYASPDVKVDYGADKLIVKGEVRIDEADVQLATLPTSAAPVSDDQIIVTPEESGAAPSKLQTTANLRLILGDKVKFEGFGLQASFAGDMSISDRTGEPTTATGEIRVVEGQYKAYGQDLTIETGKLLFVGGPIDQPGIDVRAVRIPKPDVKVGVIARGSLRKPEFSLFSQPAMSQSDQLSYLVLGRPLEDNSTEESSALSRAALALGIKGGNYLSEQFGGKLGVDKIGIESAPGEGNDQAALVVGKFLSPKLYVGYGLGLLDAVNTLNIEYLLSSRWRLTSKSSTEQSGVDLNFSLER